MPNSILKSPGPILIGMLHVPALPGSPGSTESLPAILEFVKNDAQALLNGGISNLMIENFGDAPFFPASVPAHTVAQLTAIASEVASTFPRAEIGLNVLRNDGCSALAIASSTGASFIRVNILCGARVTDQGIIQGIAHDLLRLRKTLSAEHIAILADVNVKHSTPVYDGDLASSIEDLIDRGRADAIIVSGNSTGSAVDANTLEKAVRAAGSTPVLIGSGATAASLPVQGTTASGFIIGTAVKRNGHVHEPVDEDRVREIVRAADSLRE